MFCYTPREGNTYADWLASWSLDQPHGVMELQQPPLGLKYLLSSDSFGATLTRLMSSS